MGAEAEPYYGYAAHAVAPVVSPTPPPLSSLTPSPPSLCPTPSTLSLPSSPATPGLPLRLSLHRWHCSRRHPRCRRCLRRCWTLRRQLCWNRPCCQEGGRG